MFAGTARYEVVRPIGRGGMGMVFEAHDHMRNARVALKLLENLSPEAIYRFKREFRALADIAHANLVTLHELVCSEGDWFFTMELVDGCDLLGYLHGLVPVDEDGGTEPPEPPLVGAAALAELRAKLRQVVHGTAALHAAGIVHRDLKPSNVMVDRAGRVVVLDFGLIADARRRTDSPPQIIGTPDYLSPEQVRGIPVTPASDWYSLGVILYQALTGRLPFQGGQLEVMAARLQAEAPPPRDLVAEVPEDLDRLCRDLLRPDPAARPDAAEILARLGGGATPAVDLVAPPAGSAPFVGRAGQLEQLHAAFARARGGTAAVALVSGPSGMGKSTLLRRFVDEVVARDRAIVLEGRCYERESVPYQAFDSLIDALGRLLGAMSGEERAAVAPADAGALVRVFPALRNLLPRRFAPAGPDPRELRRRALGDLRTLMQRLSARRPLLLVIDDLQWGDLDSAAIIGELTRGPHAPRLLLLLAFRSEHVATSQLLAHLHGRGRPLLGAAIAEVTVGALAPAEAHALAVALIGEAGEAGAPAERARSIAWEAGGHPMFLRELARHQAGGAANGAGEPLTLGRLLQLRLDRLSPAARNLLEVIAVAGRPVALVDAEAAAGLAGDDGRTLAALRSQHLVRTHGSRRYDLIEPYHDQIREVVLESLTAEQSRDLHSRLALAVEASGALDAELLAALWHRAGDPRRAAFHARRAADQAAEALAFGRAADLYELALSLDPELADRHEVEVRLAGALASAGRGRAAAAAYLDAVRGARNRAESVELTAMAADQLLRTGEVHEGTALFEGVFQAIGLPFARSPRGALLSAVGLRARIRLRGLGFHRRPAAQVPVEALLRIDTLWGAAAGMGFVDTIRGAEMQTRGLLLALRAGEPYRISRALASEAAYRSSAGGEDDRKVAALIARAEELAREVDSPHALALCGLASTVSAYLRGRWRTAADRALDTVDLLRARCTGVHWELASMRLLHLWSLTYLGRWWDLEHRMEAALREAEELGDVYSTTNLRGGTLNLRWLIADDPHQAQAQAKDSLAQWPGRGFQVQHYNAMQALTHVDLYCGRIDSAGQRLAEAAVPLRRSMLLSVQQVRLEVALMRGQVALAGGSGAAEARRWARAMKRERMRWAGGVAALLLAGAAAREGNQDEAVAQLRTAIDIAEQTDMHTHQALARMRLGKLLGGDEGAALAAAGRSALVDEGIAAPDRWAAMWAPGFD